MSDLLTPAELAAIAAKRDGMMHDVLPCHGSCKLCVVNALLRHIAALEARTPAPKVVRVIFDGPPSHESGRFVECEDEQGRSIHAGEWKELENGLWELRIEVANESI